MLHTPELEAVTECSSDQDTTLNVLDRDIGELGGHLVFSMCMHSVVKSKVMHAHSN
jgi:hypothetical protein